MPPLKTMHAHSCKMVEGIEIKPGRKVGRGKCNVVLGGGPVPKEKGRTKQATLTENYERLSSKTVRDTMLDSMEAR